MSKRPYENLSSRSERRVIIENDRLAGTYAGIAAAEAAAPRGRYGAIDKELVRGASSVPQYPKQSENSPANQAATVPSEPPLGFSVDALEPVGTHVEIERSLREGSSDTGPPAASLPDSPSGDECSAGAVIPPRRQRRRRSSKQR